MPEKETMKLSAQGQAPGQSAEHTSWGIRTRGDAPRSRRQARGAVAAAGDRDRFVEGASLGRRAAAAAPRERSIARESRARRRARTERAASQAVAHAFTRDDARSEEGAAFVGVARRSRAKVTKPRCGAERPTARAPRRKPRARASRHEPARGVHARRDALTRVRRRVTSMKCASAGLFSAIRDRSGRRRRRSTLGRCSGRMRCRTSRSC